MREMKKIFAGILMTVLLTGCSSQEILSEVPQTIVLPEEQIDSLPMQEEDPTVSDLALHIFYPPYLKQSGVSALVRRNRKYRELFPPGGGRLSFCI